MGGVAEGLLASCDCCLGGILRAHLQTGCCWGTVGEASWASWITSWKRGPELVTNRRACVFRLVLLLLRMLLRVLRL